MNVEFTVQLIFILQLLTFCQNSHVQHAKQQLRSMFNRTVHQPQHVFQSVPGPTHYLRHRRHHTRRLQNTHMQRVPIWRTTWNQRHKTIERPHFTRWSTWSQCNKDCIKRRERFCRTKRKCGNSKHVEEQKCWHCIIMPMDATLPPNTTSPNIIVLNTITSGDELKSHFPQNQNDVFHFEHKKEHHLQFKPHKLISTKSADYGAIEGDIFQYEDFDFDTYQEDNVNSSQGSDQYDSATANFNNEKWVSRERSNLDSLTLKQRRIYSKWSRWTKCSPKCTTTRYKKCRIREICGREVLREISYCYTEGSFCQQWLQAHFQVQKIQPLELRPPTSNRRLNPNRSDSIASSDKSVQTNAIIRDVIMNGKGYMGPEYVPQKLKCGIAPIHNTNKQHQRKRNMSNMLKIIGGKASRKGEWPWQIAVFNRFQEAFCGGTLIAPQWVLTAAHCVRKVLYVRLGEHNLDFEDGTELQMRVTRTFKHPSFDKKTVDSDVALLKLPRPVNTTYWIGFSCLPSAFQPLPANMECTVIGWGKRRNRDVAGTNVLHQADVPIIPMDNCRLVYQDYTITKNMFCAGHRRGRIDTCAGDSGGPLLCRDITKPNHPWTIFGITSFGDGCAKRNKFGIYTKVSNYVDWVWSVINCNGNCKLH